MKKHKWETAWENKKFSIQTLVPSVLVSKYGKELQSGDCVLDVGCDNGRNAIYLAQQGCTVDCFDVMDLQWKEKLPQDVQDRVHFMKSSILKYPYHASQYRAVILTRVIQYLNSKELSFLIKKIKYSLQSQGFLLVSYNTKGGIFNRKEIDVPSYSYSIDDIEPLLRTSFKKVLITEGAKESTHVNYVDEISTFDIYASDPRISE